MMQFDTLAKHLLTHPDSWHQGCCPNFVQNLKEFLQTFSKQTIELRVSHALAQVVQHETRLNIQNFHNTRMIH